jgi:hypothetical protein
LQDNRLLDVLNGNAPGVKQEQGNYLEMTDVVTQRAFDGIKMSRSTYVKRSSIHLAATMSFDMGRGLGAKTGTRLYPFVAKTPAMVKLETLFYDVSGNVYLTPGQEAWQILENGSNFLPLTHVEITSLTSGTQWTVPFVAVNKEQIISMIDESAPYNT